MVTVAADFCLMKFCQVIACWTLNKREAVVDYSGQAKPTVKIKHELLDDARESELLHILARNEMRCENVKRSVRKQEGQHSLTGQRAANFRLLANQ